MNDETYISFLNLLMCCDPWPSSALDQCTLEAFASDEARKRGFKEWKNPGVRLPITPTHWMPLPEPPKS